MPKAGYISIRMSVGRVHALDAIRIALRWKGPSPDNEGARLTDQQCLDFALDWTLASLPERLTPKQAQSVLARLHRHGWLTQADQQLHPRAFDMGPLADRVKETYNAVTRDLTPPRDHAGMEVRVRVTSDGDVDYDVRDAHDGHAFQQQEGNGCELCGLDRDTHPLPF